MTYLYYALVVAIRILYTPVVLIVCLVKYLTAVQREQILIMRIQDGAIKTGRDNDGKGSAGVTDTAATIRAKARQSRETKRARSFGSPN